MGTGQKITYVQTLCGNDPEATNELVELYLSDAEAAILRRLYRVYGNVPDTAVMPSIYDALQCKLAMRYFMRRGGEGEISHAENGVSRIYGSANDEDLLIEVMPYARIF